MLEQPQSESHSKSGIKLSHGLGFLTPIEEPVALLGIPGIKGKKKWEKSKILSEVFVSPKYIDWLTMVCHKVKFTITEPHCKKAGQCVKSIYQWPVTGALTFKLDLLSTPVTGESGNTRPSKILLTF